MDHKKEVLGKTKSKKNQIFIYKDDNTRHKIEEVWNPYINDWKTSIYQKQEKVIEENWYGNNTKIGLKREILKEDAELGENSKMMKMPVMRSEDFLRLVKKQKNWQGSRYRRIES